MKIQFHQTMYDLVTQPYVYQTRFQCAIEKGEHTYDSIIEDTVDPQEITVYDDEEQVIGVYSGYTHRIAITIMDNINIELENTDIAQQIQDLTDSINAQQTQINSKIDSSVIAEVEEIGGKSKNPYEVNETFMGDDGKYYKAVATISTGNILVVNGNIEETNINETIKESEGE